MLPFSDVSIFRLVVLFLFRLIRAANADEDADDDDQYDEDC